MHRASDQRCAFQLLITTLTSPTFGEAFTTMHFLFLIALLPATLSSPAPFADSSFPLSLDLQEHQNTGCYCGTLLGSRSLEIAQETKCEIDDELFDL